MKKSNAALTFIIMIAGILFVLPVHAQEAAMEEVEAVAVEDVDPEVMSEVTAEGTVIEIAPPAEPEAAVEVPAEVTVASEVPAGEPQSPELAQPEPVAPALQETGSAPDAPVEYAVPAESEVTAPEPAPTTPVEEFVDYSLSGPAANLQPEVQTNGGASRITINLDNVSLEDTIRMFAQTAAANIIAAPNLFTGKFVTVTLADVDWLPALRSILEIHNFSLTERTPGAGVFTVTLRGADAPDPAQIKTFFLDYTTAGEMHDSIEKMLPVGRTNELRALKFESRNALVVRSTESSLGELEKLVDELDQPAKQILIEVRILELNDQAAKEVGVKWDFLRSLNIGSLGYNYSREYEDRSETSYTRNRNISQSSVRSNEDRTQYDQSTLANQNQPLPVTSFNFEEKNNQLSSSEASSSREENYDDGYTVIKNIVNGNTLNFILDPDVFSIVISAFEETDGVSLVSNPKIISTSGLTNTFINVGRREPILKRTIINPGTSNSYVTVELDTELDTTRGSNKETESLPIIRNGYLEAGLNLQVKSTVKANDFIEAFINPQLTRIVDYKTAVVEGEVIDWPIIDVKELGTTFTLKSGQTVAIGGLTQSGDSDQITRVPFLGSIPVIGRLFSHKSKTDDKTETIIFVTLTTVDPGNIGNHDGIPQDARLVFKRLLSDEASLEQFKKELAGLKKENQEEAGSEEKTGKKSRSRRK